MGLSDQTIAVVEKSAPAVAAAGPALAAAFYKRMFTNNPELKDIFNLAHQRTLAQPIALFNSVVAYATHLRDLGALGPTVERIAQKHTSFNIQPDQYQIVGYNLLKTIEAELNPGEEVLAEWGKAYEQLANIFIDRERQIYEETAARPGGWKPTRTFKVTEKVQESEIITRFRLVPADGKPVLEHAPGQYLAIYARHPSMPYQEIRQYSIMSAPNNKYYEIAVKLHDHGQVSRYMHNIVHVGDELQLAPPYGDFFLHMPEDKSTPIALISAGVGQTPLMSMLKKFAATKETRPLFWVHASHDSKVRAFRDVVLAKKKDMPNLTVHSWLTHTSPSDKKGIDYDFGGRIDLDKMPDLFKNPSTEYYFVGPHTFMENVEKSLKARGVPESQIHFECFGPFAPLE